jgi:C-methyltransferase-like protein/putative zinc binding protein/methyltransferase family protein
MDKIYTTVNKCRICNSPDINDIINFGETALANSYLTDRQLYSLQFKPEREVKVPLSIFQCKGCGSVQLKETVDPKVLFSNYLYSSSESGSLGLHFKKYAEEVINKFKLDKHNDFVIDIGGNDAVLLKHFSGFKKINVEPASNLAKKSTDLGIPTVCDFFDVHTAKNIIDNNGQAKLITCNNCFAHIDNLHEIIEGIKILLREDGIFIFENSYLLDILEKNYFDIFYHEHIYTHSIRPLINLFMQHGMEIFRVERNNIQGGTIRCYVGFIDKQDKYKDGSVYRLYEQELRAGLYELNQWQNWVSNLSNIKIELHKIIDNIPTDQFLYAYGCPAKFTTFCKFFDLTKNIIECVVDDSPTKHNLFTPGTHIPIISRKLFLLDKPDYCLISAWNFADFIIEKNKNDYQGKFIIPFPEIKII